MMNSYSQLTYEQRCQISALNKSGLSQRKIADLVGVNQSTISREMSRNTGERGYRHKQAQARAVSRRRETSFATVMSGSMVERIESLVRLDWSPEQISGWLLREGLLVSHESIYLHIWENKRLAGDSYKHLRRVGKKYDKRRNGKSTRGQIRNKVSIDDRPKVVYAKARVGWEIDTVVGKGHSGVLVTIVERLTKFTVSAQTNSKSAEDVTQATLSLLTPFKLLVHTITADNGKEFSYHERISEALSAKFYFAHPYSSWERGLNENTNGLLRQYFPKGTDFKTVAQEDVDYAGAQLNSRPRKTLGYTMPEKLMVKYMTKAVV